MTLHRFTYANVASTLALVVALGGGGAAVAAGLAKNSVGSKQLKAGAVKTVDLGAKAVDSGKVKDDSLTGADISESTLTKVPAAASADVAGRASNQMFAVVEPNGTLTKASGQGIASVRVGTGTYEVRFGRDISQCASQATSSKIGSGTPARRLIRTASLDAEPEGIFVDMVDTTFATADGGFALTVIC